ncbi:hypothetical protein K1719_004187 [Acacia pycnantha]|nr:hypothetical protein K1719_004187 [Acacia pycnantha]
MVYEYHKGTTTWLMRAIIADFIPRHRSRRLTASDIWPNSLGKSNDDSSFEFHFPQPDYSASCESSHRFQGSSDEQVEKPPEKRQRKNLYRGIRFSPLLFLMRVVSSGTSTVARSATSAASSFLDRDSDADHDQVDHKFIADNGFKSGFANAFQSMMEEKLPGCGIKACPHITSRIKTLKKLWQTAYDMVYGTNTSGFGWDPDTKCVTADKEVWDEYVKVCSCIPHSDIMQLY